MDAVVYEVSSSKRPGTFVIGAGLFTSALSLFLVDLLAKNSDSFQLMGLYACYIIPAGALIVGFAAGSGYGLASWLTGVKITNVLLWSVVTLQMLAYFVAQYLDYMRFATSHPDISLGFWSYFDAMARAFAWKQESGGIGEPLGIWGYLFRGLEILGFALGGLLAPAILSSIPYCKKCHLYMKSRELCLLPAGVIPKKIKKQDTEALAAYEAEHKKVAQEADKILAQIREMVTAGNADGVVALLQPFVKDKKKNAKLTSRVVVGLASCRQCYDGRFTATVWSGQGDAMSRVALSDIPVDPKFCQAFLQKWLG